jgi:hypothetical protein
MAVTPMEISRTRAHFARDGVSRTGPGKPPRRASSCQSFCIVSASITGGYKLITNPVTSHAELAMQPAFMRAVAGNVT